MKKSILLLILTCLSLTACHDSERGIDYIYDGYGYYGDDLAGRDYAVSYVELGVGSGDFVDVSSNNLRISFDLFAGLVAGNKNCNEFTAEVNWFEFGMLLDFFIIENYQCAPSNFEFPEGVYLSDAFEIEITYELGAQVVVLYSEVQDIRIYLSEV